MRPTQESIANAPRPAVADNNSIVFRIAQTRKDRASAFRLTHSGYVRAGLCEPNPHGMRVTRHQLLASTDILISQLRGETICTMSLIVDSVAGLPLESIYPDEVERRRRAGLVLAEVGCLADRREDPRRGFPVFMELCRLTAQAAKFRGVEQLLLAVHPRHGKFYRRFLAFEQIGDVQAYEAVCGQPAVLMMLPIGNPEHELPSFAYDRLFRDQLPREMLRPCPISDVDRAYFQQFVMTEDEPAVERGWQECA